LSATNPVARTPVALQLKKSLEAGFEEDIGFGDITSESVLGSGVATGHFVAKADGVISGVDAIPLGYQLLDHTIDVTLLVADGEKVTAGDRLAEVSGAAGSILTGERVILNILQHMSGIATKTASFVEALKGSSTRVCDTRKTLPGLRALQKYAVRCGGGFNHRMRLDDGIMIKDNHIAAAGSISRAVSLARSKAGLMVKIEVECETEAQVTEAVEAGADIIMLDNQTPESAKRLCGLIPESITAELSGGITVDNIGDYKDCGAHYISTGSVTHTVAAFDISFILDGTIKNAE
jgi:nicotinate-nucleotide pyrophosphorylase (carboxylating)